KDAPKKAYERFIKVINLDHLIENLNTIWIGRFHLFANLGRFERPKKPNLSPHNNADAASSYPRGGEALDIEDNVDSSFGRKHSNVGPQKVADRLQFCEEGPNDDRVSDIEEVSETNFRDNSSIPINNIDELEKQQSVDPFNIYRLLRKQPGDESHEEIPVVVNAKVMHNSQDVYKDASCDNVDPNIFKKGGSVLGVMEDMIRVGKVMGYSMDGCVKDLEQIKGTQGVGNSGGILCVWEATVFKKDYANISDNFVAIYGTWLPSNSKVLFVAIYASQQVSRKRLLWDYVSTLIDRWNGEVIVLGDFNKV
nr:RNA-directed DNA polymerase, eukaryota [Tanacetum cinerariifolium]